MFIGIAGPRYSGKHTVVKYLVEEHDFVFLTLKGKGRHTSERLELYTNAITFDDFDAMHTYVTERWQEDFVTCSLDVEELLILRKRPFFLLVSVNAPVLFRYQRGPSDVLLLDFCLESDTEIYGRPFMTAVHNLDMEVQRRSTQLHDLMISADVSITNGYSDIAFLKGELKELDLKNGERLRPSWDTYFMQMADLAAHRSNCMKRRVGCILVKDSRVVATGYNGTPRGLTNCNEGGCSRCNEGAPCGTGLDRCLCMHAEENALLEAGRGSVNDNNNVVLYCNTCPCLGCAIKIIQQGVKEVVYSKSYGMDESTADIFRQANVKLRQHLN